MNQRELEELAREMERTCGHGTGPRIELCPECFSSVVQRAVESAVEKACKAVCGYHPGPVHSASCDLIRRAFSPASPAEEKGQP